MTAIIRNGRWVSEDDTPLDPVQMYQLHSQLGKIHEFAKGVVPLTHAKIEILSKILLASDEQELAIMKILGMTNKEIEALPLEELAYFKL